MKQLVTFFIAAVFAFSSAAQDVGKVAPDFTLKTLENENYKLSENRGNVILVFLVGYGCPLCIASAPTVKSQVIEEFTGNSNFHSLIIDTWDGSTSAFKNFRSTTGLPGAYLQMGGDVATSWSTTYDRLVVIDSEGVMTFKGKSAASSDANAAKQAVQEALDNVVTAIGDVNRENDFWVNQNYPNPFSGHSKIEFNLPKSETVSFRISDITGKVSHRINRFFPAGTNFIEVEANSLPGGIYFYRLDAGENTKTGKMIVN